MSEELAELVEAEDAELTTRPEADATAARSRRSPRSSGMRRARVLSRYGLHVAADRWDESFGAKTPMAQAAPASCVTLWLPGADRRARCGQAFGVCANEFCPADGRVVSLSYGCGGHSEAAVMPKPPKPAPHVLDTMQVDEFPLRPASGRRVGSGGAGRAVGGPRPLLTLLAAGEFGPTVPGGRSRRPGGHRVTASSG